jgi:hypothetical protein
MSRAPRTKDCICISLDFDVLAELQHKRGIASASAYVNNLLKKEFGLTV